MGCCASKPKQSDILESEAVCQLLQRRRKSMLKMELRRRRKLNQLSLSRTEPAKPAEAEPAPEAVKSEETQEAIVEAVEEKDSGEAEPPKQEEAATAQ